MRSHHSSAAGCKGTLPRLSVDVRTTKDRRKVFRDECPNPRRGKFIPLDANSVSSLAYDPRLYTVQAAPASPWRGLENNLNMCPKRQIQHGADEGTACASVGHPASTRGRWAAIEPSVEIYC
jgi:hypothetical protein